MSPSQPATFGDLLREYRAAAGLTQEALAERARMSVAAIGKLERGARQRPYRTTVALLAGALSLTPEERRELERAANRALQSESKASQDGRAAIRLPIHFSSFVGRERDLAKVGGLLAEHRLVTLAGAGGVGKTRLAIRVAENFIGANPAGAQLDGAWFVDLASLTDGASVVTALASSVGVDRCRTIDALAGYLRSQSFLLIFDNCEQLLDPVAEAVRALFSGCPGARILTTSRQALSLDGERVYRVPPLDCPPTESLSAREALEFDAIRLFKDRAEATDSRFELTDSAVTAVAEICRQVDGIALAIELAAARTNAFSPAAIAAQLGDKFSLLDGSIRRSLPRHKTMLALFDWSYDLLNDRERELFRQASIFAGGFTLDLVRALYRGGENQGAIAGILASLVDKSLVQCDILAGPRYRLLAPAGRYAREKLSETGEYAAAVRAHALAMLALAEAFDSRSALIPDREWDEHIVRERDNFHAAIEWALGLGGDAAIGIRLAASRTATWSGVGSGEVRRWMTAALAASDETTPSHVRAKLALNAARTAVIFEHDTEAIDASRRALALQAPDDLRGIAAANYLLGAAFGNVERGDEAERALRLAREKARVADAPYEYGVATTGLGALRYSNGDLAEARELILETLQRCEAAGTDRNAADARLALAEIEFADGRAADALQLNEKAAQFFGSHSMLVRLPMTFCNSAAYLIALGRYEEAREHAQMALLHSRAMGSVNAGLWSIQHIAVIAVLAGDHRDDDSILRSAANVLGFIDEEARRLAKTRQHTERQGYDRALSLLCRTIGEHDVKILMTSGKAWPLQRAVAEALDL